MLCTRSGQCAHSSMCESAYAAWRARILAYAMRVHWFIYPPYYTRLLHTHIEHRCLRAHTMYEA
jgi:hypothetical protein